MKKSVLVLCLAFAGCATQPATHVTQKRYKPYACPSEDCPRPDGAPLPERVIVVKGTPRPHSVISLY